MCHMKSVLRFRNLVSFTGGRDYAVPDVTKSAMNAAILPMYPPQTLLRGQVINQLDMPPPAYDPLYAASDVVSAQGLNIPNLQVGVLV